MTDAARMLHPSVAVAPDNPADAHTGARPRWRTAPVDTHGLVLWIATFVVMTALVAGLGLLIVHELGGVRAFDDRVARWLARHRTNTWDNLTWGGSFIADADVKIPVTVILCGVFIWRWRRWTEPALLAGALALEVSIFTLSSFVVDRPRPPIAHLDPIPPTGAFPSGHSAAAVAFYGAIAIIVCWHTRNRIARTVAIGAAFVVPLVVGASRMYRGMHHVSDVVVGLVIGLVSLGITWLVVRTGPASRLQPDRHAGHTGADAPVSSSTPSPATS
ncbi:MAG TPA: phosphatase PAP2 family protein [Acidimicrobiia bacterium]|jgi:undecaprenyl-diphosphatase